MKCPFCGHPDSKVVDSRPDKGGAVIRRRRECEECASVYYFERVERCCLWSARRMTRKHFDRMKVVSGIKKLVKTSVSVRISTHADRLENACRVR